MNMISTGAFRTEMDASNKQITLAKKFAAVWEKKNAKAARAGGVSLMALSLAACGSDDTTTTTATTTTTTTTTTPAVDAAKTLTLTTGTDSGTGFTGGSGDDTFSATHLTFSGVDELVGGTGSDTLTIVNTGAADFTAAAAKVSGIESIIITSQGTASAATKEVTTVTFADIAAGQTVIFDGETFTAGGAGATAEQIATSFTSGTAVGGAFTSTFALSTTAASTGASGDQVNFTATATGNATNLSVTGSSQSAEQSAQILTFATKPGNADNTIAVTINGTTLTSKTASNTNAANLTSMVTDLTAKINMMAGINATKVDSGDAIMLMGNKDVDVTGYTAAGTSNTTTLTTAYGITAGTYTFATNPGGTSGFSVDVNGTNVDLGTITDSVAQIADTVAAKINTIVAGAATSNGISVVTIASDVGIVLGLNDLGVTGNTPASLVYSDGYHAASPASAVYADGAAAVTAQAYSTTVDASKFTGSTSVASVNSTADVAFTNMVSTQTGIVSGNTALTNGNTTFGHKATATSFDIDIKDGTTAGNVTATGAAATTASISSTGEKNTVGTIDVAGATTVTVDAATNLTATTIATSAASAGTLTISGAGAVSIGTLDVGFDTVTASGNSGGLTAAVGAATDTVITGSSGNDKITASTTDSIAATAKLAVNAGGGTDTLVIGDANDINSAADGARYTGFEAVQILTDQDVSLVAGVESVTIQATAAIAGGVVLSGMDATNANAITANTEVQGELKVGLTNDLGTADSATINAASATATSNVSIADIDVAGIETLTLNVTTGTAGTDSVFDMDAGGADKLTSLVINGSADVDFNTSGAIAKGVTIDAAALTGALTFAGALIKGSALTSGSGKDAVTTVATAVAGTAGEYVSYSTGAGIDSITTTLAALHNINSSQASVKVDGGTEKDTLIMGAADATFTDASFEHVKNIEVIQIEEEDADISFISGSNINANFASAMTLDMATGLASGLDDDIKATIDMGAYTGDATVTLTSATDGQTAGDDLSVTTGSGSDTVTVTAASFTGGSNTSEILITTGDGADTITLETGTLASATANNVITAGKGADTISLTSTNGNAALKSTTFTIAAGDSTYTGYDVITGFNLATASLHSDSLDLAAVTVSANTAGTNGTDSGTLKSHAITSGIITFDDADLFATALVLGKSDLDAAHTYVNANITGTDTVAFVYDSTGNGTADSTFVFQQGATHDTVVSLMSVTAGSITATGATTADLIHIM